ncbi:iron ABC transporter substrate-binding protein [Pseudomonas sp. LTJR-52]|uniref:ABC transporter substrate-binding protein n=1 Tax=Pseudomonas sp. LTJR-52 TaxID=2479392 RepID=UPI000EFC5B83|nr:ABC transporter substrate-binding protein [Pseudomonas sp. LTJR-52]AYN95035.1 iron ABC transporter substrate-binding protein [Pseudomonas sp. LTJR-52]
MFNSILSGKRWLGLLSGFSLAAMMSSGLHAETITDIAGRQVEIPAKVDRILLGEGRMLYALALLEGDKPLDRIVGWQGELSTVDKQGYAAYQAKYPQIDKIPTIGKTSEASVNDEKAISLKPDIAIFGIAGHGPGVKNELVEQLKAAGVPVVFIDFRQHPMQNTIPSMRVLGKAVHREKQAEDYIAFYQRHLDRIQKTVSTIPSDKRPNVFIEMLAGIWPGSACCHTAGKGNFGEFIEAAGGNNLAAPLLPGVIGDINAETLLSVNPDIYIASGTRDMSSTDNGLKSGTGVTDDAATASLQGLLKRQEIAPLRAVHEGRTYGIWHNFYNSPYNILAIEAFAKWFYPDAFKDVDPKQTLDELNNQFLPVDIRGAYWTQAKSNP